jgi:hypothetical protein
VVPVFLFFKLSVSGSDVFVVGEEGDGQFHFWRGKVVNWSEFYFVVRIKDIVGRTTAGPGPAFSSVGIEDSISLSKRESVRCFVFFFLCRQPIVFFKSPHT